MDITIRKTFHDRFRITADSDSGRTWLAARASAPELNGRESCLLYGDALRGGLRVVYYRDLASDSKLARA